MTAYGKVHLCVMLMHLFVHVLLSICVFSCVEMCMCVYWCPNLSICVSVKVGEQLVCLGVWESQGEKT